MARFTLPLKVDFTLRYPNDITLSGESKPTYIKNGFINHVGGAEHLVRRPGIVEYDNGNVHMVEACSFQSQYTPNAGWAAIGYDTGGTTNFYEGPTSGVGSLVYSLPTSWTYRGADIVAFPDSNSNTGTSYFAKLNTRTTGSGNYAWSIVPGTGVTAVTDTDFLNITDHLGIAELDGYIFILGRTTAGLPAIWNSDQYAPTSWNALGNIDVSLNNGDPVGIISYKEHIMFMGTNNIQFFYDAGLSAPGSPLKPRKDLVYNVGVAPNALPGAKSWWKSSKGDMLAFIGNTFEGKRFIGMLDNFQVKRISNDSIDALLRQFNQYTISGITLWGKEFICVCIYNSLVLWYDIEEKLWVMWETSESTISANKYMTNSIQNLISAQPIVFSYCDGNNYIGTNSGAVYTYQDEDASSNARDTSLVSNSAVTMQVQFPRYRGEQGYQSQRKFLDELQVIADTTPSYDYLTLEYSDDDYQTFTTVGTVNLYNTLKQFNKLGQFRERVFRLTYAGTDQVRIQAIEGQYRTGRN